MIKHRDFHINFIKNKKIYFGISIGLILIGLIFNIVFGSKMDIKFTGGAIVKYSYTGSEVSSDRVAETAKEVTGMESKVNISSNIMGNSEDMGKNFASIEFAGNDIVSLDQQNQLTKSLNETYPGANFVLSESSSIDATNGQNFFWKCMCAIALASVLMIIYIAFRFRKIGGWSAGIMAVVSLLHDVAIIYFTFVVFGMPIDDNFVAVVLTILGYSLNDTIIIYDRIRENRRLLGQRAEIGSLVNLSINQTLQRTINTTITTALAIASVLVVSLIFNVSSVVTFAFPMLIGIVAGCYSTICIAGPLWVMWQHRTEKKALEDNKGGKKVAVQINADSAINRRKDEEDKNIQKKEQSSNQSTSVAKEEFLSLDTSKRGKGKSKLSKRDRDRLKDKNKKN